MGNFHSEPGKGKLDARLGKQGKHSASGKDLNNLPSCKPKHIPGNAGTWSTQESLHHETPYASTYHLRARHQQALSKAASPFLIPPAKGGEQTSLGQMMDNNKGQIIRFPPPLLPPVFFFSPSPFSSFLAAVT